MSQTNNSKKVVPFGSWDSPIDSKLLAGKSKRYTVPRKVGDEVWWSQTVPEEQGRACLFRKTSTGETIQVTQTPFNVRTRVNEYGGADWWVAGSDVYFSNDEDSRIYKVNADSSPDAVTEENKNWKFADGSNCLNSDWFACVRQTEQPDSEPSLEIVAINDEGQISTVVSGPDFLSAPRVSDDGKWLSWIQWNHPNMPWDSTELFVAEIIGFGEIAGPVKVAGTSHSAPQGAAWVSDSKLVFCDDVSGYWNMYSWDADTNIKSQLTDFIDAEVGYPPWMFGLQRWTEVADDVIIAVVTENAVDRLVRIENDEISTFDSPFTFIQQISGDKDNVYLLGSSETTSSQIIEIDATTAETSNILPTKKDKGLEKYVSRPQSFEYKSGDHNSYCFFYPPHSSKYIGPDSELPPLIVMGHGGPTSHTSTGLSLKIQYWTTRGFAVADINYSGSSGFGKLYRERLNGLWGEIDVNDCIAAAEFFVEKSLVDPDRIAIRGGSSAGFTVMAAMAKSEIFSAGCSLYGISDLTTLMTDTHKFESRYLDRLIGKYPEEVELYESRSPINNVKNISKPLLLLQGSEDKVVPPAQSKTIAKALTDNGVPNLYIEFEGEQHGFRMPDTIVRSLEIELWFYAQIFGIKLSQEIDTEGLVI